MLCGYTSGLAGIQIPLACPVDRLGFNPSGFTPKLAHPTLLRTQLRKLFTEGLEVTDDLRLFLQIRQHLYFCLDKFPI